MKKIKKKSPCSAITFDACLCIQMACAALVRVQCNVRTDLQMVSRYEVVGHEDLDRMSIASDKVDARVEVEGAFEVVKHAHLHACDRSFTRVHGAQVLSGANKQGRWMAMEG